MTAEKMTSLPPEREFHELDNEDEQLRILESGDEKEMERLQRHWGERLRSPVSKERMEFLRACARQRERLIRKSGEEAEARKIREPKATEMEYRLGIYREWLEPAVRDAVFLLRKKGYASYESGFHGVDKQQITFDAPVEALKTVVWSEQTKRVFEEADAEPYLRENAVGFRTHRLLPDEQLTSLWNQIAAELPPCVPAQPLTTVSAAVLFRKKQDKG